MTRALRPANLTESFEEDLLERVRYVLADNDVQNSKGLARQIVNRLLPLIGDVEANGRLIGKANGKREIEGAVPCEGCGRALVWRACGTTGRWVHVKPMQNRHQAIPRDRTKP